MPEHPNPKLRTPVEPPEETFAPAAEAYAELDVTTNFSFLRGASHADEYAFQAARLGYRAVAVTDHNSLAGVVRMHDAVGQLRKRGGWAPKLLIGTRLTFVDDAPDVLVWATDRAAYGRLCRLMTVGKRRAPKGECELRLDDLLEHQQGLLAAAVVDPSTAAEVTTAKLRDGAMVRSPLARLRDALGDRLSLATSCLYGGDDIGRLDQLLGLSRTFGVPLLATNGVHYHEPSRRALQDVLTCVRHGCTIQQAGFKLFPNGERYLKAPAQMHRLFVDHPRAIARGLEVAERCTFSLDELRYEYPDEVVPPGRSIGQHLADLTEDGAAERYPGGVPPRVRELIAKELRVITEQRWEAYFLTVHDVIVYARARGILCQGRGSAANSAVCYCLGITSVNPDKIDVLFERFISAARGEPPDIDVDFEHERREEVIQYLYQKYGRERCAMTAEVISYRGRSAVRDVGKALGLSADLVDQMAKRLDWWHRGTLDERQLREVGLDPEDPTIRTVVALTGELLGFPRHLSQHVGGMVMTRGPLCEMVPIENASMDDRTVIEWDKDDIDTVGILKVDALALGMLTCISKAFQLLNGKGRRDEGTKGLREEGGGGTLGITDKEKHERTSDRAVISGSDCVAAWDGPGAGNVSGDQGHAGVGEIRTGKSNVAGGVLRPVEHRGRICQGNASGLFEISTDSTWVSGGACDSVRACPVSEHHSPSPKTPPPNRGRGAHPTGVDHELGAQDERGADKSGRGKEQPSATVNSPFVPQSLRPSVPSFREIELHTLPNEDPATYDMICDADTIGVFQIESRAQMTMLPRLKPRNFYDLVIEVAIVRPGPIQGNMVHPYLKRRNGEEAVTYPSPELEGVLSKTLGVPLFQEQAMRIAMVGAGFSAEESDRLRRAMAAWRKSGVLETFHAKIVTGMIRNGYTPEFAEQCWLQIRGFGEYGFPESHSASFALLVYASAWIKRHHPAVFATALLNSQPMGFYAPAQIVRDAKDHGVEVRAIDVNASGWDCTLEDPEARRHGGTEARSDNAEGTHEVRNSPSCLRASVPPCLPSADKSTWGVGGPAIRLGFRQIKGLSEAHAHVIEAVREGKGRFASIKQFHQRTALPRHVLRRLAEADAFASMGLSRRQALWQVLAIRDEVAPLFEGLEAPDADEELHGRDARDTEDVDLPVMPMGQEVMIDYRTAGLSLKCHPLSLLRETLRSMRIITAAELNQLSAGRWVKVAGLVLVRQRPGTASGIVFETIEDETGVVNLIIRPDLYDRQRAAARHAALLQADGYVERDGQDGKVIHVMAKRLIDLSHLLPGYLLSSRDFH